MALQRAVQIKADICQIFVKNNMQWFGKPPDAAALNPYRTQLAESKLACVFGHAGYLINLGAPSSPNREISIRSLIQELEFATTLGLPFLVLHPGAHLGAGEAAGLSQIVAGLNEVLAATKKSKVKIALENTAGQGSCLGNKAAHLAELFDRVEGSERLGVCLDTAHFFAAGSDIRTPKGWDAAIGEIDRLIGVRHILAFHLNDSKTDLGSRVDRHAHIGQGLIGKEAFRYIVNDSRFKGTPGCIETPKGKDLKEDVMNLETLRSLVEAPASARKNKSGLRARRVLLSKRGS